MMGICLNVKSKTVIILFCQLWRACYEEYIEEVEKYNSIKCVKKRGETLLKAEADFNLWMDIYPESEPFDLHLKIQNAHDEAMDKLGLNHQ